MCWRITSANFSAQNYQAVSYLGGNHQEALSCDYFWCSSVSTFILLQNIFKKNNTRTKILHCVSSIGEAYGFSGFLLLIIGSAQRQFFVLLPGYSVQVIEVMLASRELSIYLSIRCVFMASICLLCPLLAVAVKPFCNAVIFHMSSDHFSSC